MLTAHFSLAEMTFSEYATRHGIGNEPDAKTISNLRTLAAGLERVRAVLGGSPIFVSSGYRSPKLNEAIGGSKRSAHVKGLAADFVSPSYGTPFEVAKRLAKHVDDIGFEQVIYEGAWVHVAFPELSFVGRGEVLTAVFRNGKAHYTKGLA